MVEFPIREHGAEFRAAGHDARFRGVVFIHDLPGEFGLGLQPVEGVGRVRDFVDEADHLVVLQVLANGRVVDQDGDVVLFQKGCGSDPRELEDLGRLDRAGTEDDLTGCGEGVWFAVEGEVYAGGDEGVRGGILGECDFGH